MAKRPHTTRRHTAPGYILADAHELRRLNPATFATPDDGDLAVLRPGDFAKICAQDAHGGRGERFWVTLSRVAEPDAAGHRRFAGTVGNPLLGAAVFGIDYGDPIEFEDRHVFDASTRADMERRAAAAQGDSSPPVRWKRRGDA